MSQFDTKFTGMTPVDSPVDSSMLSTSLSNHFEGFTYVAPSILNENMDSNNSNFRSTLSPRRGSHFSFNDMWVSSLFLSYQPGSILYFIYLYYK